ncbi:MAG: 2-hydroxyacyl-CoA dehydratase family protein [Candidatus Altiarchaeia archaeon]
MSSTNIFSYPEELESKYIEKEGIAYRDGTHVTSSEIWKFMTGVAPKRFPYAFNTSTSYIGRLSEDVDENFLSGISRSYLTLTMKDRLLNAHDKKGVPIVLIQGGQPMEPYFAAGGISLRPGFVMQWAENMEEGLSLRQADNRGSEILESGRRAITVEACHQISAHAAIDSGIVPIDLIAPYLCLRCSDMAYLVESHRGKNSIPRYVVDHPIGNADKGWNVDYLAAEIRTLTEKVAALAKKEVSDEELREEIRLHNTIRRLTREYVDLWWSAPVPPTNSIDHGNIILYGNEPAGDPDATKQVLSESVEEVRKRVKNSVKGKGVADDPARLFICGSCVGPNPRSVEKAGGVLIGKDDNWSIVVTDVKETGDPYENLARAALSFPYEQPSVERAEWTAEQVKKSRADGLIFMYQWGCNYQTSVARLIADVVKERTGIPTTSIEVGELGRLETLEQSDNRVEAFIEMLR